MFINKCLSINKHLSDWWKLRSFSSEIYRVLEIVLDKPAVICAKYLFVNLINTVWGIYLVFISCRSWNLTVRLRIWGYMKNTRTNYTNQPGIRVVSLTSFTSILANIWMIMYVSTLLTGRIQINMLTTWPFFFLWFLFSHDNIWIFKICNWSYLSYLYPTEKDLDLYHNQKYFISKYCHF